MRVEGSLFPACYLQGAVQPQRVARIRDSKSGQTIPKVLALRPSHRTRPPLFGASKNSNLQVYKIVAVTHPLFPIVFINGKSNWSV